MALTFDVETNAVDAEQVVDYAAVVAAVAAVVVTVAVVVEAVISYDVQ